VFQNYWTRTGVTVEYIIASTEANLIIEYEIPEMVID
jgi:hypothetical protein